MTTIAAPTAQLTLYEFNQSIMRKQPALDEKGYEEARKVINEFTRGLFGGSRFFMLLGRDLNYYTLFQRTNIKTAPSIIEEVIGCLEDLGEILVIDKTEGALECWIRNEDDVYMLLLFPYDGGVVKCQ